MPRAVQNVHAVGILRLEMAQNVEENSQKVVEKLPMREEV